MPVETTKLDANGVTATNVPRSKPTGSSTNRNEADCRSRRICVVFHIGDPQTLGFYLPYLRNIPESYDLYATVLQKDIKTKVPNVRDALKKLNDNVVIIPMPNRGMDPGGWIKTLQRIFQYGAHYEYVLKIHTKAGGPEWRQKWRTNLVRALIGTKKKAQDCLNIFESKPKVGMIGARPCCLPQDFRPDVTHFGRRIGIPPSNMYKFVGGTMFWARFEPIAKPFRKLNLDFVFNQFPPGKPEDEGPPHYMERIFGSIITQAGYMIYPMDPQT
jgi:lipopolysaccharide biosynthesis protein